jgi:uncharacterized damage-inducible protein DinB
MSDALRYPVGRFEFVEGSDPTLRAHAIDEIGALPARVRELASTLTEGHLATPYREGGWTARQVVHHIADSHVNAYVRLRWLLTEDRPTIKAYDEKRWAELPDASTAPIALSLELLTALHARWHALLSSLPADVFTRELVHPDNGPMSLDRIVQMYAWHGRHHLGHLRIVVGTQA